MIVNLLFKISLSLLKFIIFRISIGLLTFVHSFGTHTTFLFSLRETYIFRDYNIYIFFTFIYNIYIIKYNKNYKYNKFLI